MLDGLILTRKGDFRSEVCGFKGGILGSMSQFWGNLYLNITTVLFDVIMTNNKELQ